MNSLRLKGIGVLALGMLVIAGWSLGTVGAHSGNNHGTIKVHDDEEVDPSTRNQPHVSCEFWIEGFNMSDDEGHLVFYDWPPTGDKEEVTPGGASTDWSGEAEPDEDGFHFNVGPYTLPPGHYRVEAFVDQGHPGNEDHSAKSKMFWVDPCEEECPPNGEIILFTQEEECPPPPECPKDLALTAIPEDDGSITLNVSESGTYNLYRGENGGELEFLDSFTGTEYVDTNTEVGVTYSYAITVFDDETNQESEFCARAEATAIPFFTSPLAIAVATAGCIGAYVVMRRRQ